MKMQDLPVLEGWRSLPDAGLDMRISRQRIHQKVTAGEFTTATRIGSFVIVRIAELNSKLEGEALEYALRRQAEDLKGVTAVVEEET